MNEERTKVVSRICDPVEVQSVMSKVIHDMYNIPASGYKLIDYTITPFWSRDQAHDRILIVMVFEANAY